MTFKKEISLDSLVALASVIGAGAVLYARLCIAETKLDDTKVNIAEAKIKIEKIETKVEEHDKTLVELKTLVKGSKHFAGKQEVSDN